MALPVLTTPTFDLEVLSTKQKVRFRPFLVKEEKLLILAAESGDSAEMIKAMQNVVYSCSDGKLDGFELPFFDLQNLFVRIRAQSIGGITEFNLICGECGHKTETQVNLDEINLTVFDNHTNKIMVTDDIGLVMKYPRAEVGVDENLPVFDLVVSCVDKIFTNEEIFNAEDETPEEVRRFVDSLTSEQFEKIVEFFITTPKMRHVIEYKCAKCETENVVVIDGVENFFG